MWITGVVLVWDSFANLAISGIGDFCAKGRFMYRYVGYCIYLYFRGR